MITKKGSAYKAPIFMFLATSTGAVIAEHNLDHSGHCLPQATRTKPVALRSHMLRLADNIFIKGHTIAAMIKFKHELLAMVRGKPHKVGDSIEYKGTYQWHHDFFTLNDLCVLEDSCNAHQESPEAEEFAQRRELLESLLPIVKRHFVTVVTPFKAAAEGHRSILAKLILDSCTQRNRSSSDLLAWSKLDSSHEEEFFHKNVLSFVTIREFSIDLINFLDDFIHSCPKAHALYLEQMKRAQKHAS